MFGRMPSRNSNDTKYYDLLGVPKTATPDEIKKVRRMKGRLFCAPPLPSLFPTAGALYWGPSIRL
jgi:hypothetical protein